MNGKGSNDEVSGGSEEHVIGKPEEALPFIK